MSAYYQIGQLMVGAEELIPLLTQYQMMPQLLRECVIEQAIADVNLSSEEETRAIEQFYQANQLTQPEGLERWLAHFHMSVEQLRAVALRDFKLNQFKEETWAKKVETLFLNNKQRFDQVVYSLVRLDNAETAQELYFRLQENEQSFSAIAAEYSKGPEAQTGGLIGPVEVSKLHPKLAQALLSSDSGQLRQPMRVDQWIVILRLERILTAKLDEGLRKRLLDQQFQEWMGLQLEKLEIIQSGDRDSRPSEPRDSVPSDANPTADQSTVV
jgi:parvulin-like peptidyl-prolyl isomerase